MYLSSEGLPESESLIRLLIAAIKEEQRAAHSTCENGLDRLQSHGNSRLNNRSIREYDREIPVVGIWFGEREQPKPSRRNAKLAADNL